MKQNWFRLFPPSFNTGRLSMYVWNFVIKHNRSAFIHKLLSKISESYGVQYFYWWKDEMREKGFNPYQVWKNQMRERARKNK